MMNGIRYVLLGAGVCCVAAGLAFQTRNAHADPWKSAPTRIAVAPSASLPDAGRVIKRDPFAGATASAGTPSLGTPQGGPNIPAFPGGSMPQMVPNPAGLAVAAGGLPAGDAIVIGTMIGGNQRPLALVKEGNQTTVVGVGDLFAGRKIARILPQGIEFTDGSRIAVDSGASSSNAAPAPARIAPQTQNAGPVLPFPRPPFVNAPGLPPSTTPAPESTVDPRQNVVNFGASPTPDPNQTPYRLPRLYTPQPGASLPPLEKSR